jgi:hypothetical protein
MNGSVEPVVPDTWTDDVAWESLMIALAGPIGAGDGPPEWPLPVEGEGDAPTIGRLVEWLGLDERGYGRVVSAAYKVMTVPSSS